MHTKKDRCGLTVNGSLIDNARLNKQSTIVWACLLKVEPKTYEATFTYIMNLKLKDKEIMLLRNTIQKHQWAVNKIQ